MNQVNTHQLSAVYYKQLPLHKHTIQLTEDNNYVWCKILTVENIDKSGLGKF